MPLQVPTPCTDPPNFFSIAKLSPDGHLTPVECQCCMSLGLCMHCGQSGHLARNCPKQNSRPINIVEGQAIHLEQETEDPELAKKWMWSTSSLESQLRNVILGTTSHTGSNQLYQYQVVINPSVRIWGVGRYKATALTSRSMVKRTR